ncbi:MAG: HDOD domain-containing protein [Acidobacteriota bacterium]|nr:HDOD domain-containing protein [Acidobacteriota bacterium]
MPALSLTELQRRVEGVNGLPSLPAVLLPVLNQLSGHTDDIDLHKTVELVSHDSSLTSQVLHMANSPLFGMQQRIESLRGAALALGVRRLRDIVTSCCLMQVSPRGGEMDAASLWEHSLACALVTRNLARRLGYPDIERAYLAGLVHDLGILVNMILIPKEFAQAYKKAAAEHRPLRDVEQEVLGLSHDITGDLLATHWHLFDYLSEVMRRHHDVEHATEDPMLVALVCIADQLCRTSDLGYGYTEEISFSIEQEPAWNIVTEHSSHARELDLVCFTLEIEAYVNEVRGLVSVLFRV